MEQLTNPLLVEEVVEHLFKLLREAEGVSTLGPYRLVCKPWDKEIAKLVRSDTKINLEKILLPYPEGMGWATLQSENGFHYSAPYSGIRPFENINLKESCWKLFPIRENKLQNWFGLMGAQVRTLEFEFSLSDSTKSCRFLENILKDWCPNLRSITLSGTLGAKFIIFASDFKDPTKEIICKDLKEVKIIGEIIGDFTFMNADRYPFVMTHQFNQFIHQHGLPGCNTDFPECNNRRGMKFAIPSEHFKKPEFPDVSQFIPENFFREAMDGGVLGQLMSTTSVEKLSMLECINRNNFGILVAISHFRKNCWRSSLKHLELHINQMKNISRELVVFGKLGYPIATLKFKEDFNDENRTIKTENMTRFLECFSDTLQYLEYIGTNTLDGERPSKLVLPVLPNLKTFIYKSMTNCPICPINVLTNLPNLENLHLEVYEYSLHSNQPPKVYQFLDKDVGNLRNDHLKRLRIAAALSVRRACNLLKWFPKVERMDINVQNSGIARFINQLADSDVKHLKIRLSRDNVRDPLRNTAVICEFSRLKNLKSLEMHCGNERQPFAVLLAAFTEGFGLLTQLQLLRLTNFGIFENDKQEIQKSVGHIPLVQFVKLCCHRVSTERQREMRDSREIDVIPTLY